MVCDILLRINLLASKLMGQCYDGASVMSGRCSGLVKMIADAEPRAAFTHCYWHALT